MICHNTPLNNSLSYDMHQYVRIGGSMVYYSNNNDDGNTMQYQQITLNALRLIPTPWTLSHLCHHANSQHVQQKRKTNKTSSRTHPKIIRMTIINNNTFQGNNKNSGDIESVIESNNNNANNINSRTRYSLAKAIAESQRDRRKERSTCTYLAIYLYVYVYI